MSCIKLKWKVGDTFKLPCKLTKDGADVDLTGWLVKSQLRYVNTLISELTYVVIDALQGLYSLEELGSTQLWPVGVYTCDIEYTDPTGLIVSTETFTINFIADVTHV